MALADMPGLFYCYYCPILNFRLSIIKRYEIFILNINYYVNKYSLSVIAQLFVVYLQHFFRKIVLQSVGGSVNSLQYRFTFFFKS